VEDVNAPEFLEELRSLGAELLISVSCPQIFKKPLIELPPHGILNIHGAILPQYRGVLPSFWMLANGERQAGVSIYYVDTRIDAGELCGQRVYDIPPDQTLDGFLRRSKEIAGSPDRGRPRGEREVTRRALNLRRARTAVRTRTRSGVLGRVGGWVKGEGPPASGRFARRGERNEDRGPVGLVLIAAVRAVAPRVQRRQRRRRRRAGGGPLTITARRR
jgi:hypothetical protein